MTTGREELLARIDEILKYSGDNNKYIHDDFCGTKCKCNWEKHDNDVKAVFKSLRAVVEMCKKGVDEQAIADNKWHTEYVEGIEKALEVVKEAIEKELG